MSLLLHYIYDPLCGWCYGAAPLLQAAAAESAWTLVFHAGGMLAGANRQPLTPALRQFVFKHDLRIAELTGQPFGEAYREGLLYEDGVMFDSEPPITAMLAAAALGGELALVEKMLRRIQRAHFVEGRRIAEPAVLAELGVDIGLDPTAFRSAFEQAAGAATQEHIAQSRALLHRVNGGGFPAFAFERDGQYTLVDHSRHLGRPEDWVQALRRAASIEDAAVR